MTDIYISKKLFKTVTRLYTSYAPFIWSRVPETTFQISPPPPQVTLAEVTYSFNQPFTLGSRTRLGGPDNAGGRVVSPRQVGGGGDNFSSYKRLGSPTQAGQLSV